MSVVLEVDDAIVLVLGAPTNSQGQQNRVEGITRLEKLLFLLERETTVGEHMTEDPDFRPYNFGPFSAKIYQMIPILSAAGLITDSATISETTDDTWEYRELIEDSDWDEDPYSTRNLELTEMGQRYYSALLDDLPDDTQDELRQFKTRFGSLPLRQLVRYVYQKYPDFTVNSVIRDAVLGT